MHFVQDFKDFINRGNMMDLAIGVIIGGAFSGLVKSLTVNLINPLVGLFTGKGSTLSSMKWVVSKHLTFTYGAFLNDLINFFITALVVFFLIKFIHKFVIQPKKEAAPAPSDELLVLQDIKKLLEQQSQSK
ncbi:large-conductance mechanosensitive channel [Fructobacillus pseudoficulneus]|uniref:Large-conductance mechanosensitive channel n=1 Tax=Fructobacillus pseudoficulneus TaxID=220714 RepID=A0A3F3H0X2_9LACO|nr:large conductance mechanosensitive channel protein MscL [Fructobacillus pseudoficulneus]GAP02298.1 large-conductance mechanosensitive channel [Fructobacillus pseudoficulneus]SEH36319.1 large conductance mechanosensitive channel [Fructobacillus pseudoficulneus]